MNCERFQDLIDDLARDEALDGAVLHDALAHADSCRKCDALLEEAESLTSDLDALAWHHGSEQAPVRVENALLQHLRQQRAPALRPMGPRWVLLASAGSIAAAALAIVLLTGPSRGGPAGTIMAQATAEMAAPAVSNGDEDAAVDPDDLLAGSVEDEDAAESFLPLSGAFDASSLEDGTIVRVVMSRSALESFGLPLSVGTDSQVIADLILGSDGTPEAIRVVGPYDPEGS